MKLAIRKYSNLVLSMSALMLSVFQASAQAQQKTQVTKKKTATSYVIETQVQGSQEQPKVLYITPWQELDSSVNIDEHNLTIKLPPLNAVNPKVFKEKVNNYYQQAKAPKKH
ncbi:MAG: hypothetical protein ACPG52_03870 [Cognaticolwellia sp.]